MRILLATLLSGALGSAAAAADRSAPAACLSPGDAHEAVGTRRAVAPVEAIASARKAVPNGEVLRAALCREADALVYRVTVLGRSGRVVRVTLEAGSGKVAHLR